MNGMHDWLSGDLSAVRARHFFAWLMRPLGRGLAAAGVPPNAITTLTVVHVVRALGAGGSDATHA